MGGATWAIRSGLGITGLLEDDVDRGTGIRTHGLDRPSRPVAGDVRLCGQRRSVVPSVSSTSSSVWSLTPAAAPDATAAPRTAPGGLATAPASPATTAPPPITPALGRVSSSPFAA